jgi:putative ABC transport system permease protein
MKRWRRTPLAWLNLTHDRRRLLTSVGGVAFAVLLIFIFTGFKNALYDSQVQLLKLLNGDIVMSSTLKYNMFVPEQFARRRLYQARSFEGVEAAYPFYTNNANWKNSVAKSIWPVRVLAFNPSDPVINLPELQLGAGLSSLAEAMQIPNSVLLDLKSRTVLGPLTAGVRTELSEREVAVVGNYSLGTDFASGNGNLVMSDQNFLRYFADLGPDEDSRDLGTVDIGLIMVRPGTNVERLVQTLNENLPKDVQVTTKEGFVQQELTYWRENTNIGFVFNLLTTMCFVVGIILVYQILYTDVADHWAEYATLKAMGYRNIYLLGVVLQEAVLLSILGFIPGFLIMQMTPDRALSIYAVTFVMCLVSGAIAVRKVQATDPAEVFG